MTNPLITIDVNNSVPLVEVDDVMDNSEWKFCEDSGAHDEPRQYEEFVIHPESVVPAGFRVYIKHLWGYNADSGLTNPTDYELFVPEDAGDKATVARCVHILLSSYHQDMKSTNANSRFYYIENADVDSYGNLEIIWGS